MSAHIQPTDELLSIGGLAKVLNCSPSLVRQMEREGITPPALRLVVSSGRAAAALWADSGRRVYRPEDVRRIQQIRAERAARRGVAPATP